MALLCEKRGSANRKETNKDQEQSNENGGLSSVLNENAKGKNHWDLPTIDSQTFCGCVCSSYIGDDAGKFYQLH